jgi:hypothetical protein
MRIDRGQLSAQREITKSDEKMRKVGLHRNELGERQLGSSGKVQDLGLDRLTGSAYIANTHTPGGAFDDDRSLYSD